MVVTVEITEFCNSHVTENFSVCASQVILLE
jgi:hypothetical protein